MRTNPNSPPHHHEETMKNSSHVDQKALKVAREIHSLTNPLTTILFGSRARGDHRPDSDIDVLLIQDPTPDDAELKHIDQESQDITDRHYPAKVKVKAHITSIDITLFTELEPFINSLVSRALLEGTTISNHPHQFKSRYQAAPQPQPLYDWDSYKASLGECREDLKVVHIAVANMNHDTTTRDEITFEKPWDRQFKRDTLGAKHARIYLKHAMRNALKAAVEGSIGVTKFLEASPTLMAKLKKLAPTEDLTTLLPFEEYATSDTPTWDGQTIQNGITDVEKIRKLAMRLRRQTQKSAKNVAHHGSEN